MITQDEIYVALKAAMADAGCLSEQDAQTEGWTTLHERAWFSFTYHKLGLFPTPQIPMNESQMMALVPSMRRFFQTEDETENLSSESLEAEVEAELESAQEEVQEPGVTVEPLPEPEMEVPAEPEDEQVKTDEDEAEKDEDQQPTAEKQTSSSKKSKKSRGG
jgi:hypothetical protein